MTQAAMENTEKIVKQKEALNKQSLREGNQAFSGLLGRVLSGNDVNELEKP